MKAPMKMVHTHYSEIVVDVTEDMEQRAWCNDALSSLGSRVEEFEKMLVEIFYKHCDFSLYTLK